MVTETLPAVDQEQDHSTHQKSRKLPPWNVVLIDDDYHTYEYVIEMLHHLFGYPIPECYLMAKEVDTAGRVIVMTTHRERAEFERDRIHAFGADHRIAPCVGSMSCEIEPAPG